MPTIQEVLPQMRFGHRKTILPHVEYKTALKRAGERRKQIEQELESPSSADREFLHVPEDLSPERKYLGNFPNNVIGQTTRLKWQLAADELLLLERVVDTVVAYKRSKEPGFAQFSGEHIFKLEFLGKRFQKKGLFPWQVVIETDQPQTYLEALGNRKDWMGISVALASPNHLYDHASCQNYDGREGMIGGILAGKERYGMTCQHVLSRNCSCVRFGGDPTENGNQPDAALITESSSCFDINNTPSDLERIRSASNQLIETCMIRRTRVVNMNTGKKRTGTITARISAYAVKDILYRFPHLEITSNRMFLGTIPIPFLNRYFSFPGNSGSWLSEVDTGGWVGMIIAGSERPRRSFAAEADPLLQFFDAIVRRPPIPGEAPLVSYKFD